MSKKAWVDEIGEITLAKRRSAKGLRLSVNINGQVRISMPRWVPYRSALAFAKKRKDWIIAHKQKNQKILLRDGARIGKTYNLQIIKALEPIVLATRIAGQRIIISTSYPIQNELVQRRAIHACERALLKEAKVSLPPQLLALAEKNGFNYKELRIRKLTSRWGSCSSNQIITLSYFLVQLPDEFIKYVMLHELVHTKFLNHSPDYWARLEELVPSAKLKRRQLREHKPRLEPSW
ncbi:M48 family metallopeptidase [Candidatus Saccharibacteria bacterium]|nr:M48 family metallopeptidase [Candidatus Saccharibacteria bacterium]